MKDFARIMPSNDLGFKIIFLDEADQLTPEAQAALRRKLSMRHWSKQFTLYCKGTTGYQEKGSCTLILEKWK